MMKKLKINKNHCIGGWYIDTNVCDEIIKIFQSNKSKATPGQTAQGVNKSVKESLDLIVPKNHIEFPFNQYRLELQKCLNEYIKVYEEVNKYEKFNIVEDYHLQYYDKKQGFKKYHWERSTVRNSKRILTFMTYLNDVEEGGTIFKYQNVITKAKKGLTLIWPVDWTHTHKGQISKKEEKYIVTGWFGFENN